MSVAEIAAAMTADELLSAGLCSAACLLATDEPSGRPCDCRCVGRYHGVLRSAAVPDPPPMEYDPTHPPCLLAVRSGTEWLVVCPFCWRRHRHGPAMGRRVAHCHRGEYLLIDPDAACGPWWDCCPRADCSSAHGYESHRPIELRGDLDRLEADYQCAAGHRWTTVHHDRAWRWIFEGGRRPR